MLAGLGPNPRMGIPVAHDVQPEDVLYYVKAMLMVFANHGNFKNRGKARTRYIRLKWVGLKLSSNPMKKHYDGKRGRTAND